MTKGAMIRRSLLAGSLASVLLLAAGMAYVPGSDLPTLLGRKLAWALVDVDSHLGRWMAVVLVTNATVYSIVCYAVIAVWQLLRRPGT